MPDRCYTAKNGLSYCWCSTKDLCNSAPSAYKMSLVSNYGQGVIQYLLTWSSYSYIWQNGFTPLTIENEIQLGFQLLLSAFFWYAYNNGIIHQFISKQQPQYILWWASREVIKNPTIIFKFWQWLYCIKVDNTTPFANAQLKMSKTANAVFSSIFIVWRILN